MADSLNDHYGTFAAGNVWLFSLADILTESLGMGSNASRFFSPFKPGQMARNRITPALLETLIPLLDASFRDLRKQYGGEEMDLARKPEALPAKPEEESPGPAATS